ncbi:ATP-binding protein [Dyadobacter sp. CY107]|uniref:sensor histidine kinase n=1 Tax=Dyadobacter fanqingshengii TaxID=2906443 RepID=UPI001F1B7EDF|nr:ATP-binding protein [Dyadobacter fanqingshengii]MCF2502044.1 ATP-binding protein [Dyadobacter fanqingshengii]
MEFFKHRLSLFNKIWSGNLRLAYKAGIACGPLCATAPGIKQKQNITLAHQANEFFAELLATTDWPARWNCGTWSDLHGWIYIVSDLMIWAAYFAIPVLLVRVVTRRKDLPFSKVVWLFGAFIILCGLTHLIDAAMFWWPAYRLNAVIRSLTGVVSIFTVYSLYKILPQIFSLRFVNELENEIRERKIVEEKLAASEFLLSEAGRIGRVGGWELNVETKQSTWSKTIYEIYEVPYDYEIRQEEAMDFFPGPYKKVMGDALEGAYREGKGWDIELQLNTGKQNKKWVRSQGEPFHDQHGKLTHIRGVFMDIDSYKTSEIALQQTISDLESSNNNLQQFGYVASHDLQEPLRKIQVFGAALAKRYGEQLGDGINYVNRMQLAASRMSLLIDDLLAFATISTRQDSNVPVEIEAVVQTVLSDLDLAIQETGATIVTGPLPRICGDKTQLGQVFQNLIGNALKFRVAGIAPVIRIMSVCLPASELPASIKPVRQSLEYYRIDVSDNGIGFDQKNADRIFHVFQRLHGKSEFSGTGIGLSICQKVVASHGGAILASSMPGQGATFSLFFPVDI